MTQGWKEVAKAFGFVLLFGIIAWNLYAGAGLFIAIFRGVVAWLIFQILNILLTNFVVRQLSQYEYKRLREIAEEEEREEMLRAQEAADEEADYETESEGSAAKQSRPKPRPKPQQPKKTQQTEQQADSAEAPAAPAEAKSEQPQAAGESE